MEETQQWLAGSRIGLEGLEPKPQFMRFGLLRRFLRVNSIPAGLAQRVTRFLHYTYHATWLKRIVCWLGGAHGEFGGPLHLGLPATGLKRISELPKWLFFRSKSLSAELRVARYQEQLCRIQFFARVMSSDTLTFQDGQVVQRLAREALTLHDCAEDDVPQRPLKRLLGMPEVLFCQGQLATASYFMMQGDLNYQNEPRASPSHWVAEMCLWTTWQHSGDLLCTSFGKMLAMHVQDRHSLPVNQLEIMINNVFKLERSSATSSARAAPLGLRHINMP